MKYIITGGAMFSCRHFKENDALKEFMLFCIDECKMIPDINKQVLNLFGEGISLGIKISTDPICLEVLFVNCNISTCYENVIFFGEKLIEYANKYNVVIGIWVEDIYVPICQQLGFKVVEILEDDVWLEYSQLLH